MGYSATTDSYHTSSSGSPSALSERAAAAPPPPSPHNNNNSGVPPARFSDRSSSGETEIIDNRAAASKGFVDDDEKTMEYSTATAPTQTTGLSQLGPGQAEEDDTTTIRSLDSIQERELIDMTEEDDEIDPYDAPASAAPASAAEATSTCSVSTAPLTCDEASSLGGVDWNSYDSTSRLKQQIQQQQHRRVPSWEVSPHSQFSPAMSSPGGAVHLPPSFSPASGWGPQQPRLATFRGEQQQQGHPPMMGHPQQRGMNVNSASWAHQHQNPPRYGMNSDPSLPFLPPSVGGARGGHDSPRGMYHHRPSNYLYSMQQPQQQQQQQPRKPYSQPPLPRSATTTTPPRGTGDRAAGRGHHRVLSAGSGSPMKTTPGGPGGSRSSSEILKTLLRKKACLYDPDTSRAVALVTWLVGRELALQYGFFSRQQLQAGVHACVAGKIDSGIITRTKVNRCMQIILNSCFHYIIPRPDGTEESGDSFREVFAKEMKDDYRLLSVLPAPWNDIVVNRNDVLLASQEEEHDSVRSSTPKRSSYETPHSSPKIGSIQDKGSPGRDSNDGDESVSKRAVLLCFNENVRRAEDVFRCHNEFIRDTAHACNLQLSSNEWRIFFGREAASTPFLWGNIGIPVPYLEGQGPAQTDALGVLTREEVSVLRTSWCCKRYEHDHELCGFAHSKVNGGWLRRDPSICQYKDKMCQYVSTIAAVSRVGGGSRNVMIINECPYGVNCEYAHSTEELVYHPHRYKQRTCISLGRAGGCPMGDVCPGFHPADSYRFPKKSDGRSPRHSRHAQQNASTKASSVANPPLGSPILYASPAPISSFERHLLTPGLQSLFRRHSSVVRASVRGRGSKNLRYSCFGDDAGINETTKEAPTASENGSRAVGPPEHVRI